MTMIWICCDDFVYDLVAKFVSFSSYNSVTWATLKVRLQSI